jgi:hypothetical protein
MIHDRQELVFHDSLHDGLVQELVFHDNLHDGLVQVYHVSHESLL